MKMKIRKSAIASILILTIVVLSGCINSNNDTKKVIHVGMTVYRGDDAFMASLASEAKRIASSKSKDMGLEVVLTVVDSKNSQVVQNDQVDDFLEKKYDIIIVNMVDRTVSSVIIDKAKEANIPVIFYNKEPVADDMKIWNKVYYVGADAAEGGVLQGELLIDAYIKYRDKIDINGDGKLQYVMLEGDPMHQDSIVRTKYSVQTVVEAGIPMEKIASESANFMRNQAYEIMTKWIPLYLGQMEVVMCNNDHMALGAIDALKNAAQSAGTTWNGYNPIVLGVDGLNDGVQMVSDGYMWGTVRNNEKKQAKAVIDIAVALANGEDPEEKFDFINNNVVRIPHELITKDNVDKYLPKPN